ncbi:MAG: FAD-dependent oxidoreductase [Lachnospiraceae bacterium]|nr:FAD-dependent oxidoreductase [Lachnospiraceae bacterium]
MEMLKKKAAIIGGGPAGLSAAVKLYESGVKDIIILEREPRLGGILNQCIHDGFGLARFREALSGPEYAGRYIDKVHEYGIEYLTDCMVINLTGDKEITADTSKGLVHIKADAVILAMGCRERPRGAMSIPGDRPSGVFTAGVAQNYINIRNEAIGKNIVILGSGDIGLIMARRLTLEGAKVLGVYEIAKYPGGLPRNIEQCLNDYDIPLYLNTTVTRIKGRSRLESVVVSEVDENFNPVAGSEREIKCDTLILSVGLIPENEISLMAGVELDPRTQGPKIDAYGQSSVPGIFAVGNALKVYDLVDNVSVEAERIAEAVKAYLDGALSGAKAAVDLDRFIIPKPKYLPGKAESDTERQIVCIMCPNGCLMDVKHEGNKLISCEGYSCPRGLEYAGEEISAPRRNFASLVKVNGGELPLVSVRLTGVIPKEKIFEVESEIQKAETDAPVKRGQVIISNVLSLGVDVIATKDIQICRNFDKNSQEMK